MTGDQFISYVTEFGALVEFQRDVNRAVSLLANPNAPEEFYKAVNMHHVITTSDQRYRLFMVLIFIFPKNGFVKLVDAEEVTDVEDLDNFFPPGSETDKVAQQMIELIYARL